MAQGLPLLDAEYRRFMQDWFGRLTCGNYRQTQRYLVIDRNSQTEAFCCLGLFCLTAADHQLGRWESESSVSPRYETFRTQIGHHADESDRHAMPPSALVKRVFGEFRPFHAARKILLTVDRWMLRRRHKALCGRIDQYVGKKLTSFDVDRAIQLRLSLVELNDEMQCSFEEIAKTIRCSVAINGRENPLLGARLRRRATTTHN